MGPTRMNRPGVAARIFATFALLVLLVGSVAHQHREISSASPEHCTACALTHATADAPLAVAPEIAPPPASAIELVVPAAQPAPRGVAILSLAPKTSPPSVSI